MKSIEMEIEDILKAEITVYEDILFLEEEKGRAIMKKDGRLIEELSVRQESLVREIDELEKDRTGAAERYRRPSEDHGGEMLTLRQIAGTMDEKSSASLLKTGDDLKKILISISEKQEVNARMIQDNIDFFNILISDLKNSS